MNNTENKETKDERFTYEILCKRLAQKIVNEAIVVWRDEQDNVWNEYHDDKGNSSLNPPDYLQAASIKLNDKLFDHDEQGTTFTMSQKDENFTPKKFTIWIQERFII